MKYILLCLALISGLGAQAQLNEKAVIEEAAYNFLISYYTFDLPKAKEYSDTESLEFMNMIQEMLDVSPIPDSLMNIFLQTEVKIHPNETKITGDSTRVSYRLVMAESTELPSLEKNIKMVKVGGQWLAHYTMMDAMSENNTDGNQGEAVEEYAEPSDFEDIEIPNNRAGSTPE